MAAGFKEVIQLIDMNKMDLSLKTYFVTVLEHLLNDKEDKINQLVLPTICSLVKKFDDQKKLELLESLIKPKIAQIKALKNGRDSLITVLE